MGTQRFSRRPSRRRTRSPDSDGARGEELESAARKKQPCRQPATCAPPRRRNVRGVVQVRAPMKGTNRQRLDCTAAPCTDVYDPGVRPETNAPSRVAQPPAEVGIFPIKKVTLVEAAYLVERLPFHHDARAADPVDRCGCLAFRQQNI